MMAADIIKIVQNSNFQEKNMIWWLAPKLLLSSEFDAFHYDQQLEDKC